MKSIHSNTLCLNKPYGQKESTMINNELAQLFRLQQCEKKLASINDSRKVSPEAQALSDLRERQEKFAKVQRVVSKRLAAANKKTRTLELSLAAAEQGRDEVKS